MLAADKLQLQSALKQQATALKEKEFQLHHTNLMTVGTQAAVLAGLDVTMFIEFQPPANIEWAHILNGYGTIFPRTIKFFYYACITVAFCCNVLVVGQTTILSVLGSGFALRGPDGSMIAATDGIYEERIEIFKAFGLGLATTVASAILCVWLILHPETATICMGITVYTAFRMYNSYLRILRRFYFDESKTVDFRDILDGPANISAYASSSRQSRGYSRRNKHHHQDSYDDDELESGLSMISKNFNNWTGRTENVNAQHKFKGYRKPKNCDNFSRSSRSNFSRSSRSSRKYDTYSSEESFSSVDMSSGIRSRQRKNSKTAESVQSTDNIVDQLPMSVY